MVNPPQLRVDGGINSALPSEPALPVCEVRPETGLWPPWVGSLCRTVCLKPREAESETGKPESGPRCNESAPETLPPQLKPLFPSPVPSPPPACLEPVPVTAKQ
jgi:hypothetical protein